MNVKLNIGKVLIKLFCVYLFGTIFSFSVHAQIDQAHKGMHLLDRSSNNTTKGKLDLSIVDLSSSEKGFMLPRMTTAERSAIPVSTLDSGLVIYNTTIDCIEFYNATRQLWLSTCGKQDPAVFDISTAKCDAITVDGNYAEGKLVDERSNLIFLDVNVSEPGTFSATAIAYNGTNKNGYVFTTKGIFPTIGQYRIVLKGSGKPIKGYGKNTSGVPLGNDLIKFYFNEAESTCTTTNFVDKDFEPLVASFLCNSTTYKIVAEGAYKINVPLKTDNIIKVPVMVTKPGRGKVFGTVPIAGSQTELIQYESAVTDFVPTATNGVQWVTLKPLANTGKPTTSGKMKVNFKAVSKGLQEYDPFANASITEFANCSHDIDVEGDWAKFNSYNVKFASENKSQSLKIPYIMPRTRMKGETDYRFVIGVTINATAIGKWEFETDPINGVTFKGSGTIDKLGSNYIVLNPYGESEVDGYFDKEYIYDTSNGKRVKVGNSFAIDFVYQPMKMLSIGNQGWHPAGKFTNGDSTWDGTNYLLSNPDLFSWNGKVRIDGFEIFTSIPNVGDATPTVLLNYLDSTTDLNNDLAKADMVFIGGRTRHENTNVNYEFPKSNNALQALANYVKKGGVLVYGESSPKYMPLFTAYLGSPITSVAKTHSDAKPGGRYSGFTDDDKIIRGQLGRNFAVYNNVTLFNKRITGSNFNSEHSAANISFGLNSSYTSLVNYSVGGEVLVFKSNRYSFVGVGNGSFMGGRRNFGGHYNGYPVGVTSSRTPDVTVNNAVTPNEDVYNAWFLLNLIHWSIDEAQNNKNE